MSQTGKFLILIALSLTGGLRAEITPEELERWFRSDEFAPPRETPGPEARPRFLDPPPRGRLHHQRAEIAIVARSLDDGWVRVTQCHENMDPADEVEIVFRPGRARGLEVVSRTGIGRAWVAGDRVRMASVHRGAAICVRGWLRSLRVNDDGSFTFHGGPYMRRRAGGYLPMHVSARLDFAGTGLKPAAVEPAPQPGFRVYRERGALRYEAWFTGRLRTTVRFSADIL